MLLAKDKEDRFEVKDGEVWLVDGEVLRLGPEEWDSFVRMHQIKLPGNTSSEAVDGLRAFYLARQKVQRGNHKGLEAWERQFGSEAHFQRPDDNIRQAMKLIVDNTKRQGINQLKPQPRTTLKQRRR